MNYYIASEQGPLGPYTPRQLKLRGLGENDLVWCDGMSEWLPAGQVQELVEAMNTEMPPEFNKQRYDAVYSNGGHRAVQQPASRPEECPNNYLWLVILTFVFGNLICAVVALIQSLAVKRLWSRGEVESASKKSRSALVWCIVGIVVGLTITTYQLINGDLTEMLTGGMDLTDFM